MTRFAEPNASAVASAASASRHALSADERALVPVLQARIEALVQAAHGLDNPDPEVVARALVMLDELRLDPLGPVVARHPLLEALLERFDAFRDAVPDGSAVVEAQQALDALTASQAVAGSSELFERAEALERAAVALARAHGEAGRVAQDALDDLALRIRDGAAPQALTVLRESVQARLDALKAHTVESARQAMTGAAALHAALQDAATSLAAPAPAALPESATRVDLVSFDSLAVSDPAPSAQAVTPTAPERLEAPALSSSIEAAPSTSESTQAPKSGRPQLSASDAEPEVRTVPEPSEPSVAQPGAAASPVLKLLRGWLAEDAKYVSDEALSGAFEPSLIERAREAGITPADVRKARSLLRTAARSAGQNAQRIDLAIALEALVASGVAPASLPQPGAPVRTAPSTLPSAKA